MQSLDSPVVVVVVVEVVVSCVLDFACMEFCTCLRRSLNVCVVGRIVKLLPGSPDTGSPQTQHQGIDILLVLECGQCDPGVDFVDIQGSPES